MNRAKPLYLRALEVFTQTLPENHPYVQGVWGNLRYLIQQAVQQGQAATLSPYPTTQTRLREIQHGESRWVSGYNIMPSQINFLYPKSTSRCPAPV